jgi:hypothetical protein
MKLPTAVEGDVAGVAPVGAEILRDLAAQVRFGSTRNELVNLAENLDGLAAHAEGQISRAADWSPSRATSQA